jgi:hypothetical protein
MNQIGCIRLGTDQHIMGCAHLCSINDEGARQKGNSSQQQRSGKGGKGSHKGDYARLGVDNTVAGILSTHSRILWIEEARRIQWIVEIEAHSPLAGVLETVEREWNQHRKGKGKGDRMEKEKHEALVEILVKYIAETTEQASAQPRGEADKKAIKYIQRWLENAYAEDAEGESKCAAQSFQKIGRAGRGRDEGAPILLNYALDQTRSDAEKRMRKQFAQKKTSIESATSTIGETQDQKTSMRGLSMTIYPTCSSEGSETMNKNKEWRPSRKATNKRKHSLKGNGVEQHIEVEQVYDMSLDKTSLPGYRLHFTDGALEGDIGGWGIVSEGERAQSGPALTNDETSSVIPEMFAMKNE